jgi:hypothetical protein
MDPETTWIILGCIAGVCLIIAIIVGVWMCMRNTSRKNQIYVFDQSGGAGGGGYVEDGYYVV